MNRTGEGKPTFAVHYPTPTGWRYYTGDEPTAKEEEAKAFTDGAEARRLARRLNGDVDPLRPRRGEDPFPWGWCLVVVNTPKGAMYYTGGTPTAHVEEAKYFGDGSEARLLAERLDGVVHCL